MASQQLHKVDTQGISADTIGTAITAVGSTTNNGSKHILADSIEKASDHIGKEIESFRSTLGWCKADPFFAKSNARAHPKEWARAIRGTTQDYLLVDFKNDTKSWTNETYREKGRKLAAEDPRFPSLTANDEEWNGLMSYIMKSRISDSTRLDEETQPVLFMVNYGSHVLEKVEPSLEEPEEGEERISPMRAWQLWASDRNKEEATEFKNSVILKFFDKYNKFIGPDKKW